MNLDHASLVSLVVDAAYILVAFLFISGLKRMSSPATARGGILDRKSVV